MSDNPNSANDADAAAGLNRRQYMQLAAGGMVITTAGCADDEGDDGGADDDGTTGSDVDDGDVDYRLMGFDDAPPDVTDVEEDAPLSNPQVAVYWADQFEEEHGYTYEYQQLSIEDWRTQQAQVYGGSEAPYLGPTLPGMENAPALTSGDLMEVSQLVEDHVIENRDVTGWQFENGELLNFGTGDDYYGIPTYMSGLVLWYNEPILNEAGVDPDDLKHRNDVTWEEFNDVCRQVRDNTDKDVLAFGNQVGGKIPYMLSTVINKTIGYEEVLAMHRGDSEYDFTSDEIVEAYELIEEWWEEDFIIPDTLSLSENEADALFFRNEAAFISAGTWIPWQYDANADPDELNRMGEEGGYDYMWWPYRPDVYEGGQHELLGFPVGGWVVPSIVEENGDEEMVSDWLNGFFSEEYNEFRAEYGNSIMAHTDHPPNPGGGEVFEAMHEDLMAEENQQSLRTDDTLIPEFGETLNSEGQRMFDDSDPVGAREILEECQEAWEDGMERYQ